MANDLEALAARVEAGSGADEELSEAIALALGWKKAKFPPELDHDTRRWIRPGPERIVGPIWEYTPDWLTSLDAVLALAEEMLPGWRWEIHQFARHEWRAKLEAPVAMNYLIGEAATECRARLSCILRAKAREGA